MGAEEGSKCVRPEALRSKPGDVRGQWQPVEGRAAGNRPGDRAAAGSGSRTGPAGTQQKPQTCRRTWPSSLPRCDWHAPQDRVSLVVFSPPFRTKEEDLRGKCALMVSFSWEAATVCVWRCLGMGKGHGRKTTRRGFAAFRAETSEPSSIPSGGGAAPQWPRHPTSHCAHSSPQGRPHPALMVHLVRAE